MFFRALKNCFFKKNMLILRLRGESGTRNRLLHVNNGVLKANYKKSVLNSWNK